MATQRFKITVSSRYAEWWRYNVAMMCGCFDAENRRTGFVTAESTVAPTVSSPREQLTAPPAGYPADRSATLETPPCDHARCLIYLIPHALPAGTDIEETAPFEIDLSVAAGRRTLLHEKRKINQWSGASIELLVSGEKVSG